VLSRNLIAGLLWLAITLPVSAQIQQTVNNSDWNAGTWGPSASTPTSNNTYSTVAGLTGTVTDPVGVAYTSTLRANDNGGTATFGGSSVTISANTRLLLKQINGDTASANLTLANNSNTVLADSVPGNSATLAGSIQVPAASMAYLGLNNPTPTTLNVTSTLTGSGTLALGESSPYGAAESGQVLNLNGNLSGFTGNITIYTMGTFSIGSNAMLSSTTLTINNTSASFPLNTVITVSALTVGTKAVPAGVYTASQLNTATGTTVFSGTGGIVVGSVVQAPLQISDGRLTVSFAPSGAYQITSALTGWTFAGALPSATSQISIQTGSDSIGAYQQISFSWIDTSATQMTGTINLYTGQDTIVFSDTLVAGSTITPPPFPNFTTMPQNLSLFSYHNNQFAPPIFSLENASAPWVFFDTKANTMIISPASHCLPASMIGDGRSQIASGFNSTVTSAPSGFTQKTVMAISSGINHTFDTWGLGLTNLYGKTRPANDADTLLRYYGYWTDNGANYYYNYNQNASAPNESAYEATLQNLVTDFGQNKIPIHYMQLDSWWYDKSGTDYTGSPAPGHSNLPAGPWNLYGGELNWAGDSFLFPNGVLAYSQALGAAESTQPSPPAMPFVCHARWIDTIPADSSGSTFYSEFGGYGTDFTGVAGVSSRFWNSLATYAKANNIQSYEQDWLQQIIAYSPVLTSTVDQGDAFLGNMAGAFAAQGITIQYCLPIPATFLQAAQYNNVTNSRVSFDRFEPPRYHNFLYTSRLASSMGIWPFSDVFLSGETQNLLLSDLSAGPIGTGDYAGYESPLNLFCAIRGDGVIVKPDVPLVPTDGAYVAESAQTGVPLIASTHSNNGVTTTYAVAIPQSGSNNSTFTLSATDLGVTQPAYFYDYFGQTATLVPAGGTLSGQIASGGVSYFVVAPVGASGIAFLGDSGKFVSNGKKRIKYVTDQAGQLTADVLFAPTDTPVTLHGYSNIQPVVSVQSGQAATVAYNATTGHFTVAITPSSSAPLNNDIDPAREVIVTFTIPPTAPKITGDPSSASITLNVPFSFTYPFVGYPAPTFSLLSGSLPPGLTLSPSGVISGTPTQNGNYTGTVIATNGVGNAATQTFSITVGISTDTPTMPPWGIAILMALLLLAAARSLPRPVIVATVKS
jgi:hypothetical protein